MKLTKTVLCILLIFATVGAIVIFPPKIIPDNKDRLEFFDFSIRYETVEKMRSVASDIVAVSSKLMPQSALALIRAYKTPTSTIKNAFSELLDVQ